MGSIGNGIYEGEEPTYKTEELLEENQLFQVNNSIRELIAGLENKNQETTEQQDEDKTQ
jgi:hypothetical protein